MLILIKDLQVDQNESTLSDLVYHFVTPPSTTISDPVQYLFLVNDIQYHRHDISTYLLASLARNTQAPLISSGSATRWFIISSFHPSSK